MPIKAHSSAVRKYERLLKMTKGRSEEIQPYDMTDEDFYQHLMSKGDGPMTPEESQWVFNYMPQFTNFPGGSEAFKIRFDEKYYHPPF
jgi:hypothetical protein